MAVIRPFNRRYDLHESLNWSYSLYIRTCWEIPPVTLTSMSAYKSLKAKRLFLNIWNIFFPHMLTIVCSYVCVHMLLCVRVCHLCWHCSPRLPIWQLVIDWLLNATFTHMCTHTCMRTPWKVHYTSISEPVLTVMEDRWKVLGKYPTYSHLFLHT